MRKLCRGLRTDQGLLEALHGGNATCRSDSDGGDGGSGDRPGGERGRGVGGGEDGRNDVLVAVGGGVRRGGSCGVGRREECTRLGQA